MCELCDLKAKADRASQRMNIRMTQLQQEIQDGREEAAKDARRLAEEAFQDLLDTITEHAAKVDAVKEEHGPPSLFDLLGRGSGGSGSLN